VEKRIANGEIPNIQWNDLKIYIFENYIENDSPQVASQENSSDMPVTIPTCHCQRPYDFLKTTLNELM